MDKVIEVKFTVTRGFNVSTEIVIDRIYSRMFNDPPAFRRAVIVGDELYFYFLGQESTVVIDELNIHNS